MIDEQRTLELFGYVSSELSRGSHKPIIKVCDECGKYTISSKNAYRNLCKSCVKDGKRNSFYGKKHTLESKIKSSCTKQNIDIKDFKEFLTDQKYCSKFNESLREQIRDKYNNECFICGKYEENNNQKLSVHHINRNKQQGCDGSNWALIPVCMSCHNKIHTKLWENRLEYLIGCD